MITFGGTVADGKTVIREDKDCPDIQLASPGLLVVVALRFQAFSPSLAALSYCIGCRCCHL
jgi:hypothetical protein